MKSSASELGLRVFLLPPLYTWVEKAGTVRVKCFAQEESALLLARD